MAIRIAMDGDRLKRLQAQQMTPIRAQAAPSPMPSEKSGMQMMGDYVANKAAEKYGGPLVEKGFGMAEKGLAGMFTPAAAAPTQAAIASQAASTSTALPLLQGVMGGAGTGAAATGAAAAGAGAGAAPMLAALGPVGMAIGAGLLMKQFGLFSKGGHVGPLYSATGSSVDPLRKYPTSNTGFRTKDNSGSQFSDYTVTPPTSTPPVFDLISEIPVVETPSGPPSGFVPYGSGQDPRDPGSTYTVFNQYSSSLDGKTPEQMTWDQMTRGQQTAQYYTSPSGVSPSGEFTGTEEGDIAMNKAMWVQNTNPDEADFTPLGGWDIYNATQDSSGGDHAAGRGGDN